MKWVYFLKPLESERSRKWGDLWISQQLHQHHLVSGASNNNNISIPKQKLVLHTQKSTVSIDWKRRPAPRKSTRCRRLPCWATTTLTASYIPSQKTTSLSSRKHSETLCTGTRPPTTVQTAAPTSSPSGRISNVKMVRRRCSCPPAA